jgi:hypothetical protein
MVARQLSGKLSMTTASWVSPVDAARRTGWFYSGSALVRAFPEAVVSEGFVDLMAFTFKDETITWPVVEILNMEECSS